MKQFICPFNILHIISEGGIIGRKMTECMIPDGMAGRDQLLQQFGMFGGIIPPTKKRSLPMMLLQLREDKRRYSLFRAIVESKEYLFLAGPYPDGHEQILGYQILHPVKKLPDRIHTVKSVSSTMAG